MPRYVIERSIPEIGTFERQQLRDAAKQSNGVLSAMQGEGKFIQWEHSYVANDRTFCVYVAADESLVHEHAQRSGFPATVVTPISSVIDPVTAEA